ncbi:7a06ed30-e303-4736-a059-855d00d42083 [Sclerotinia trifoliorum]|uniref:7a06ed30-e303-4736-a059-855d00d42083 n=1 Tax=Sclerotinia trifoliorum TaxID=28548 RepID=A0A8H2VU77_9HELO|nr:7a06ed30-e303-4736-a059-855d00d42083 [Sclerotinia trifoliorum]
MFPRRQKHPRPPRSRPRSRPRFHQQGLSIGPHHSPSLSRQTSSSSSSQRAADVIKKPIPPDKVQHASKLYSEFRMKEGLAQRSPDPNATSPRSIESFSISGLPGPLTNGSQSSQAKTVQSFDATPSDWSSVMSFDPDSQYSGQSGQNRAVSYQGHSVAQRTRRKFDPVSRAKTALIRYLGACQSCKDRSVPCPLEHHEIESLVHAHQSSSITQETDSQYYNATSPTYELEISNTPSGQATPITSHGGYVLQGVGGNFFGVAPEIPCDRESILSLVDMESSHDQILCGPSASIDVQARAAAHYSLVQNGGQFPLGVWVDSIFKCYYLDGECQQYFMDEEALQAHFETAHFEFNRINPCRRYICTQCCSVNAPFCNCGGTVKLFICGNYIRSAQLPPEPPTRQRNFYTKFDTSSIFSDPSYAYSDSEQGLGLNVNEAQDFGDGVGTVLYGDGSSIYPGPGVGILGAYTYDSTQPGGNRYNRNVWMSTQRPNKDAVIPIHHRAVKFGHASKQQKISIFILLSLMLILTGTQLVHWIISTISKIDKFLPSISTLGFIGFLVSFATTWATRHIHSIHKAKKYKVHRCPLHAFTPLADQYGQRVPPILMQRRD